VLASGKLTKFRFFSAYETVKSIWPELKYTKSQGSFVTRVSKRYSVWDPNCFVAGSLKKVLKDFRIEEGKLDMNHEQVQKMYEKSKREGRKERGAVDSELSTTWTDYLGKIMSELIKYND
jgi:hypothetical protein